jgi:pyruvate formate lyase activating enzyme
MKIKGLAKLTLLDFPGKVACTVFTGGCNFKCPFCHNASLAVRPGELPDIHEEEFFSMLSKRKGILDGVCITGGEPLLMPDIAGFIGRIKEMGYSVKLDTNGSFPEQLAKLIDLKLIDMVAMDIKNSPEKYQATGGLKSFDMTPIYDSVKILMNSDIPYEFRTTVVKELHSAEDFARIGEWISGCPNYFLQNYVDSENVLVSGFSSCSKEELLSFRDIVKPYVGRVELRGVD